MHLKNYKLSILLQRQISQDGDGVFFKSKACVFFLLHCSEASVWFLTNVAFCSPLICTFETPPFLDPQWIWMYIILCAMKIYPKVVTKNERAVKMSTRLISDTISDQPFFIIRGFASPTRSLFIQRNAINPSHKKLEKLQKTHSIYHIKLPPKAPISNMDFIWSHW